MSEIDKIFKDVFSEIDFNKTEIELQKELIKKEKIKKEEDKGEVSGIIDNLLNRLDKFRMLYGTVDEKLLDKSVDLVLERLNCVLVTSDLSCECGANITVKYVMRNQISTRYTNYTDLEYTDPGYMYYYTDYRYLFHCGHCGAKCIITSPSEIVKVIEILSKKGLDV